MKPDPSLSPQATATWKSHTATSTVDTVLPIGRTLYVQIGHECHSNIVLLALNHCHCTSSCQGSMTHDSWFNDSKIDVNTIVIVSRSLVDDLTIQIPDFSPSPTPVVTIEPVPDSTRPLLHMSKEMGSDRRWNVWLRPHPDNFTNCQLLPSDQISYGQLILTSNLTRTSML